VANLRKYYALSDAAAYFITTVGIGWLKFEWTETAINSSAYLVMVVFLLVIMAGVLYFQGVYETEALLQRRMVAYFMAVFYAAIGFFVLSFYIRFVSFSRVYFTAIFPISFGLAILFRTLLIKYFQHRYGEKLQMPILALGLDLAPEELAARVRQESGLRIITEAAIPVGQNLSVEGWKTLADACFGALGEDVEETGQIQFSRQNGALSAEVDESGSVLVNNRGKAADNISDIASSKAKIKGFSAKLKQKVPQDLKNLATFTDTGFQNSVAATIDSVFSSNIKSKINSAASTLNLKMNRNDQITGEGTQPLYTTNFQLGQESNTACQEVAATVATFLKNNERPGLLIYESPNLPLLEIVEYCETNYIPVYLVPSANGFLSVPFKALDRKNLLIFTSKTLLIDGAGKRLKRFVDVLFSLFALAVTSWLFVFLWLLVRLTSEGPGLFVHERLGLNGQPIRVYKFRTMIQDAEERLKETLKDEAFRKEWENGFKLTNDPRVTPMGRWLRRTSLDELPQLLNILRGDISLVGPRPIVPEEIERYGEQAKLILRVKPGLTGLWQVSGRSDVSYEERIRLDTYYIHNWSLALDLRIFLQTIPAVLRRRGAQ
jgi:exopolysaccharide biosynthesis polyprenyl glycosylphosphotransferase